MKGFVPPDPETDVSKVQPAVIRTSKRRRKRIPAGCVTLYGNRDEAIRIAAADPALHPAMVLGPSKSSEGQYIYYLMEWLDPS